MDLLSLYTVWGGGGGRAVTQHTLSTPSPLTPVKTITSQICYDNTVTALSHHATLIFILANTVCCMLTCCGEIFTHWHL